MLWMLAALTMVATPHMLHLPVWASLMFAALILSRYHLIAQNRPNPPKWMLALLTVGASAGIFLSHATLLGKDAGVSMVVVMASLKLMEIRSRRDVLLILFLSYFLVLTNFLYSESVLYGAYLLIAVLLVTVTLIGLNHPNGTLATDQRVRTASVLMAQAIPVMLVLFVLFPRIPGPIWSLPTDARSAHTGLSNSMSPGSISNLGLSDEIAFRVTFQGNVPHQDQLYWRGPVLWDYDGITWTIGPRLSPMAQPLAAFGRETTYTVTLEPHNTPWLLALDLPIATPPSSRLTPDFQLLASKPLTERVRYQVTSELRSASGGILTPEIAMRALQLPRNQNPGSVALAQEWRANSRDSAGVVAKALAFFHTQPFVYTLRPPRLGDNPIDEFMFNTRRGFCEHYAGSFVFLMRAAGIPARVVTGYQGGEFNPLGRYMIVRQADAHAWAEVWLPRKGWTRVDPTAAVSPDRIEKGIASALPSGDPNPLLFRSENRWMADLAFSWDSFNNAWNQWVLSYNQERQLALLSRLWDEPASWREIGISLTVAMGILLLLLGGFTLWQMRDQSKDNTKYHYDKFCAKLARAGIVRQASEGPVDFARRATVMFPESAEAVIAISRLYVALRYGETAHPDDMKRFKQLISAFNPLRKALRA